MIIIILLLYIFHSTEVLLAFLKARVLASYSFLYKPFTAVYNAP